MQYVQTLVRQTGRETDEVVLSGEQDKQWDLRDCKPSGSYAERCPVLSSRNVVVDILQGEDEAKISAEQYEGAERRQLEPGLCP